MINEKTIKQAMTTGKRPAGMSEQEFEAFKKVPVMVNLYGSEEIYGGRWSVNLSISEKGCITRSSNLVFETRDLKERDHVLGRSGSLLYASSHEGLTLGDFMKFATEESCKKTFVMSEKFIHVVREDVENGMKKNGMPVGPRVVATGATAEGKTKGRGRKRS